MLNTKPLTDRATYLLSASFFIRAIGLVYVIASFSMATQVLGLMGAQGITPVGDLLRTASRSLGPERYWLIPTLAWLDHSDLFLQVLCWAGAISGLLAFFGVFRTPALSVAWLCYLSIVSVGSPFLMFQWDSLLLEVGFLAIFLSLEPSNNIVRILIKCLAFKLMFLSGYVKLASHDPVWKNLTALQYHYETQPLPPWTAWYAHHLPEAFQKFSCFCVLGIELVLPFFIFLPRRIRHTTAIVWIGFQGLIMLTGNYTFFNWLTIALCVLLLDDSFWPNKWFQITLKVPDTPGRKIAMRLWSGFIAVLIGGLTLGFFSILQPLRIANHYGLFAVMTTQRPEIIVEGSDDGQTWKAYEFKYKPGDMNKKPGFVQPFQPRLDWQMWFAALGTYRQNPWFIRFCRRLLEGSKPVTDLIKKNPFPNKPPRFIRAVVYQYHFSSPEEKRRSGAWWQRQEDRLYCPVLSL